MSDQRDLGPDHNVESSAPDIAAAEIVEETVDGLPVLAEVRAIEPTPSPIPAVQAAAVAATGFFAGALAMALVKRYAGRKLAETMPAVPASRPVAPMRDWPVGSSRTYLVNVRLIARSGE